MTRSMSTAAVALLALHALLACVTAAPTAREAAVAAAREGTVQGAAAGPAGVWTGMMGVVPYQKGAAGLQCTTCQAVYAKTFGTTPPSRNASTLRRCARYRRFLPPSCRASLAARMLQVKFTMPWLPCLHAHRLVPVLTRALVHAGDHARLHSMAPAASALLPPALLFLVLPSSSFSYPPLPFPTLLLPLANSRC